MKEDFHQRQYYIASAITFMAILLYEFGPQDRIALSHDIAMIGVGFVFGVHRTDKGRQQPTRWDDPYEAKGVAERAKDFSRHQVSRIGSYLGALVRPQIHTSARYYSIRDKSYIRVQRPRSTRPSRKSA